MGTPIEPNYFLDKHIPLYTNASPLFRLTFA